MSGPPFDGFDTQIYVVLEKETNMKVYLKDGEYSRVYEDEFAYGFVVMLKAVGMGEWVTGGVRVPALEGGGFVRDSIVRALSNPDTLESRISGATYYGDCECDGCDRTLVDTFLRKLVRLAYACGKYPKATLITER